MFPLLGHTVHHFKSRSFFFEFSRLSVRKQSFLSCVDAGLEIGCARADGSTLFFACLNFGLSAQRVRCHDCIASHVKMTHCLEKPIIFSPQHFFGFQASSEGISDKWIIIPLEHFEAHLRLAKNGRRKLFSRSQLQFFLPFDIFLIKRLERSKVLNYDEVIFS